MTIREAIKIYTSKKAEMLNMDYLDIINNTSLCITVPLVNGVEIFIDMHPEMKRLIEEYPHLKERHEPELPNRNGVFKRISFEILDCGAELVMPDAIKKYVLPSACNYALYYVHMAKEKYINDFIGWNGGIDGEKFVREVEKLWRSAA